MAKMKALLLCAGLGTRLRPLTNKIPKCLIKVKGVPILEHWLNQLEKAGVEEVVINTHYMRNEVLRFLEKRRKTKIKIYESYETNLLGTAGTLLKNKNLLSDSEILLVHADNYTNFNLKKLVSAHRKRPSKCLMTMLTFFSENPQSCGIVKTNKEGVVTEFFEKIENPPSEIANGAVFVFDKDLINFILEKIPNSFDFSRDVIPHLMNRIYTFHTDQQFIDIGTPQSLKKANLFH